MLTYENKCQYLWLKTALIFVLFCFEIFFGIEGSNEELLTYMESLEFLYNVKNFTLRRKKKMLF